MMTAPALSSNLNAALVVAVEISRTAWVIAAHAPGLGHIKIKPRTPRLNGKVERSHRIDSEEFYCLLEGEVLAHCSSGEHRCSRGEVWRVGVDVCKQGT